MRTTFFIMVFSITQIWAANSYSQSTRLSLNLKNISAKTVLSQIEDKSQFYFIYDATVIDVEKKVSIELKDEPISKILDELFEGTNVVYKINDRQIALTTESVSSVTQQPKSISGEVTDSSGSALPGVSVVIKGTTKGTISDMDGKYTLANVPDNATLVFSFVGMKTHEFLVAGKTNINVTLTEDAIGIDEVVAIGYGTMKKSDLTGSVSQIKTETLESVPVYNMEQALKVGTTGVRVEQNSGTPGARVEVRIRGGNSMIGDNQPLYVVDGFPVTGGIDFLNPSDIESVDILKDASATAIYGSRGANGVVIITSKRGKKGQNRIDVDSYYGIQNETKRYDLLDAKEYAVVANEWLKNEGLKPYFDVDKVENPGTDWQDVIFRQAPIQNHTITFTGSSNVTRYSLSGNYYDQLGILENTGVSRGSVRLNLDHELKSWCKLNVNIQLSRREQNSNVVDNGNRGFGMLSSAASAPPTLLPYDEDGLPTQIEQAYIFGSTNMRNPLIYLDRKDLSFANSILGNTAFDIKLTSKLSFKTLLGLQYQHSLRETFTPVIYSSDLGDASESNSYSNSFLNENTLTYSNRLNEDHSLNIVGGYTYQTDLYRSSSISVSGFSNNTTENYDLGAAEIIEKPNTSYTDWTLASFLSRVNYSFRDKYMITASIRADGSSRFGDLHKWGYFPSGAIAWRVSEESFLKRIAVINNFKLRASYGITGNTALSPYQSLDRLSSANYIFINHADATGFVPTGISNSDLKWETTSQLDVGFDLNILNDRLRFVFDYYKKNTKDLLASVPLPPSVGFGSILKNMGEIQNQGIEFSVNADLIKREFKWNASAQISTNKNKVLKLAGDSDVLSAEDGTVWPSANIARIGEPLGSFYGLLEDGLDNKGLIKYKDVSGSNGEPDGIINSLDRVLLGSPYPDFIYGFMSDFSYKNFGLNMVIDGVFGNEIFWATAGTHLNSFQRGQNQFKDLIGNYWTQENPDPQAKYPKISSATQVTVSDRFIKDGSYLRLKSLRLAYNLPTSRFRKLTSTKVQVYLSGTNLFTLTSYPGLDPEVNTKGTDSSVIGNRLKIGHDESGYPNVKIYGIGLKLSF